MVVGSDVGRAGGREQEGALLILAMGKSDGDGGASEGSGISLGEGWGGASCTDLGPGDEISTREE